MDAYDQLTTNLRRFVDLHNALSGETIGPSGATWQDVAHHAAVELRLYADKLDRLADGAGLGAAKVGALVFPSLTELIGEDA